MSELAERGAALLGARLVRAEALGGGSLSQIVRITLVHSRQAIVKTGPSPPTEAAMLRAIAASGTPAPAILAADTQVLIIASLPQAGRASEAWSDLGAQLARLHAVRGTDFAWDEDYALGSVWIENA